MASIDPAAIGFETALDREWLCVNHSGGYASSTILGLNTRKYHGLLVAAMTPPVRRMVLLSRVEETLFRDGWRHPLASSEYPGVIHPGGHQYLKAFDPDPFPRWAYQGDGWTITKQLRLVPGQNTVILSYALLASDRPLELQLKPLFALRGIHELMYQWNGKLDAPPADARNCRIPPTAHTPEVFFAHDGEFNVGGEWYLNTIYRREDERGYSGLEDLWMPGTVRWMLAPGQSVHFACSTDPIDLPKLLASPVVELETAGRDVRAEEVLGALPELGAETDAAWDSLVKAGERFLLSIVRPNASPDDQQRSVSTLELDSPCTAIQSAYPWATHSIRDALIALPGLLLTTGRLSEARMTLLKCLAFERDGLTPLDLPEDGSAPRYAGAGVSLWFANAAFEYFRYNPDDRSLRRPVLDGLLKIIAAYRRGIAPGIAIGDDALISVNTPADPATWMNARSGDRTITPRNGKPVELNALWYNTLCIAAKLALDLNKPADAKELTNLAKRTRASFNEQFWNPATECCWDVVAVADGHNVDGNDPSLRPNQLLAASLPFAILDEAHHPAVLERVRTDLLTPVGVRTLARTDSRYRGRYVGDVVSRDQAHHNGSAFPWLLGPLAAATVRVQGACEATSRDIMKLIQGPLDYLQGSVMGTLPELFDGDAPHRQGGAPAEARAVGEIMRVYWEYVLDHHPPAQPKASPPPAIDRGPMDRAAPNRTGSSHSVMGQP